MEMDGPDRRRVPRGHAAEYSIPCYLLVLGALSVPLWGVALLLDSTEFVPVRLPVSALQFVVVPVAVALTVRRAGGSVRAVLRRGLDWARIRTLRWRVGVLTLMPLSLGLAYAVTLASGNDATTAMTPPASIPVFVLVYGVSAFCEELGWVAVMSDRLLKRHNARSVGVVVGLVWATWHLVPFLQIGNPTGWVFWQFVFSIVFRVLLTETYVATNHSMAGVVAMHASSNVAFSFVPYYGSSYDPFYAALTTGLALLAVMAAGRRRGAAPAASPRARAAS